MKARLITIYILSLLDLAFTLYLQSRFGEIEANPFGQVLLGKVVMAAVYKFLVVGVALFIIYERRSNALAVVVSWVLLAVFALLTIYHIIIISSAHYILFIKR